jgi:glycosyltransferase involved in cell wall biosynthesis
VSAQISATPEVQLIHVADQALAHAADCLPIPTVVTCHDLAPLTQATHYASPFEAWTDRALLRRSYAAMRSAARVIAVSHVTAAQLSSELGVPPDQVSVVPNVVDERFRPLDGSRDWLVRRGIPFPDRPTVLSVGTLRPNKNVQAVLAAMRHPYMAAATLVRVGERLDPAAYPDARVLARERRLIEVGHTDGEMLARLYSAATVLAMPSRFEGFGLPVIEAMACGTPVVCSDGGALAEVAGGAAIVVGTGDGGVEPASLAQELARIIDDDGFAEQLSADGIRRAKCFEIGSVAPRLAAAYRRAVEDQQA